MQANGYLQSDSEWTTVDRVRYLQFMEKRTASGLSGREIHPEETLENRVAVFV